MSTTCLQLFVYGSLRSGFHNPAYEYLTKYFHLIGEAVVRGRLFDKGAYPVAVPSDGEHYITGELYELNNIAEYAWAIEQLDDYEGLNVEEGEHPDYARKLVEVFQEGKAMTAWIYWYNNRTEGMPPIETGDVLKYIRQKN